MPTYNILCADFGLIERSTVLQEILRISGRAFTLFWKHKFRSLKNLFSSRHL